MIRKLSIVCSFGLIEFEAVDNQDIVDCMFDQIEAELLEYSDFHKFSRIEVI